MKKVQDKGNMFKMEESGSERRNQVQDYETRIRIRVSIIPIKKFRQNSKSYQNSFQIPSKIPTEKTSPEIFRWNKLPQKNSVKFREKFSTEFRVPQSSKTPNSAKMEFHTAKLRGNRFWRKFHGTEFCRIYTKFYDNLRRNSGK